MIQTPDALLELMDRERLDADELARLLIDVHGHCWREVQRRALADALHVALETRYWATRTSCDRASIERDPFAAVLEFGPLRKRDYWDHAEDLRVPGGAVEHRFYTSGTESGIPTEQPWDRWSFAKNFIESSALALLAAGARSHERVLAGISGFGALGLAFRAAAERLGLRLILDELGFSDPERFTGDVLPKARAGVEILIGAPGSLAALARRLEQAGVDPRTLGVRGVITGIGSFASEVHCALIRERFAPLRIVEQGGKNEILHSPGGLRYDREAPERECVAGFLHTLPWASHVVAVDPQALAEGSCRPIGHERPGVLLMTRLAAGRRGCAAHLNDAGDYGMTRGFGGVDSPPCPCGNSMPGFRFLGRVGHTVENKVGDSMFAEELVRALALTAADLGFEPALAVALRVQVLLIRDADPTVPDSLTWIIGGPPQPELRERLIELARGWPRRWPKYPLYAEGGRYTGIMRLAGFVLIDAAALPHRGRDKPGYPLALAQQAAADQTHAEVLDAHLRERLAATVLHREVQR